MVARIPFFYGWVIVAVAFVTMSGGVNARTAFSLLLPPIIAKIHGVFESRRPDLRVDLGGLDTLVPQQTADFFQVMVP